MGRVRGAVNARALSLARKAVDLCNCSLSMYRNASGRPSSQTLSAESSYGNVCTFSLLGEKGEGVVFSRPLRVKGPARGVSASCMTLADPQTEADA